MNADTPRLDKVCQHMPRYIQGPAATLHQFAEMLEKENSQFAAELAELRKDKRRLDWLELTASGLNWQLDYTGRITREAIDAVLNDADLEEEKDIENEP